MDDIYNPRRRSIGGMVLNCLTFAFVLATLIAASGFAAVFSSPGLIEIIDPFLPWPDLGAAPTIPPTLGFPTVTSTPEIMLGPTWTPTISETPSQVPTQTLSPEPTATDTPRPTTPTPGPSPTGAPFVVQPGSNVLVANFANDLDCAWLGVAGQVFDLDRAPLVGLTIHVEGTLAGQLVDQDSLTGSNPIVGPGGYTINLSDHPIESDETMWAQLMDTAGLPLSARVSIDTSASCSQNLVSLNWNQIR